MTNITMDRTEMKWHTKYVNIELKKNIFNAIINKKYENNVAKILEDNIRLRVS